MEGRRCSQARGEEKGDARWLALLLDTELHEVHAEFRGVFYSLLIDPPVPKTMFEIELGRLQVHLME